MGMSEILVILLVAALFLGPEKLPDAATKISKGIRDLRRQTKDLQDTIENDTELGGAIKDLKSALRGDELRRPPVRKPPPAAVPAAAAVAALETPDTGGLPSATAPDVVPDPALATDAPAAAEVEAALSVPPSLAEPATLSVPAKVTLAPTVGEPGGPPPSEDEDAELAKLVRPASGAVKRDGHGPN